MSKKKKNKDKKSKKDVSVEMSLTPTTSNLDSVDEKVTSKRYLKKAEKIINKLDKVLGQLQDIADEAIVLRDESVTTDVSDKDLQRFAEIATVIHASGDVLYHLLNRMSRKYAGKEIKPFSTKVA
jgi:hypothetical protein